MLKNFSFFLTILCSSFSFSSYAMEEIDSSPILHPKKQNTDGLFSNLPEDVRTYIFTFLEVPDLLNTAQVSRMFYKVSSKDIVWKRHIKDFDKDTFSPYKKYVREEKENPVFFYIENILENGCVVDFPYSYVGQQQAPLIFWIEKGNTHKIRRNNLIQNDKPKGAITSASLYFKEDGSSKNSKSVIALEERVSPPYYYKIVDTGIYLGTD